MGRIIKCILYLFPFAGCAVDGSRKIRRASTDGQLSMQTVGVIESDPTDEWYLTMLLNRGCVELQALDWPEVLERNNYSKLAMNDTLSKLPIDLVTMKVEAELKLAARSGNFNMLQNSFTHNEHLSLKARYWRLQIDQANKALETWGFSYDVASYRCGKGPLPQCMLARACGDNEITCDAKQKVQERLDARSLLEHPAGRKLKDSIRKTLKSLDAGLTKLGFMWAKVSRDCQKEYKSQIIKARKQVMQELQKAEEGELGCVERLNSMCPEGTYATNKRRILAERGAKAFSLIFATGKGAAILGGTVFGAITGGPAGATAGLIAGNVFPLPIVLATAAGFWLSLGRKECACFPRSCIYSNSTGSCHVGYDGPTKNPFGAALPMPTMKCVPAYKTKSNKCVLQECSNGDYVPALPPWTKLNGTVGKIGNGLHNCMSTDGYMSGAVGFGAKLLGGEEFTTEKRNGIFKSLDIPERFDLGAVSMDGTPGVEDDRDEPSLARKIGNLSLLVLALHILA